MNSYIHYDDEDASGFDDEDLYEWEGYAQSATTTGIILMNRRIQP